MSKETREQYNARRKNALDRLKRNMDHMPLEHALDDLTDLGLDPSLIFDDNGKWACGGDSCSHAISEPGVPFETHIVLDGDDFKDTPREAVRCFVLMCIAMDEADAKKEEKKDD